MSEMVERAARAAGEVPIMCGTYSLSGDDAVAVARAVIEAMREPTAAMIEAGSEKLLALRGGVPLSTQVEAIFRAMIDAALTQTAASPPPLPLHPAPAQLRE